MSNEFSGTGRGAAAESATPGLEVLPEMPATALALATMQLRIERFRSAYDYRPALPDEAMYSGEPVAYIGEIRAAALAAGPALRDDMDALQGNPYRALTGQDERQIGGLIDEYLAARPDVLDSLLPNRLQLQGGLAHSDNIKRGMRAALTAHVRGFAVYQRVLMYQEYDVRRAAALRAYIPEALDEAGFLQGTHVLKAEAVAELEQALQGLQLEPPIPDLLRLPLAQQQLIVEQLMDEGQELCRVAWGADNRFAQTMRAWLQKPGSPLLALSMHTLRAELAARPEIDTGATIKELWRRPESFATLLHQYDIQAAGQGLAQGARAGTRGYYLQRHRALTQDGRINQDVRNLVPDAPVLISQPDLFLRRDTAAQLLSDHLDLLAFDDYAAAEARVDQLPLLKITVTSNILSRLIPRQFHGNISNLTLVELPIDDTWREKRFPRGTNAALEDSIRRIGIGCELTSTATPSQPITVTAEVAMHMQYSGDRRNIRLIRRPYATDRAAQVAVRKLIAESRQRAGEQYRYSIMHPYRGGLPHSRR